jgi:hypothetical protein
MVIDNQQRLQVRRIEFRRISAFEMNDEARCA